MSQASQAQSDYNDPLFQKKLIDAKAYLQTVGTKMAIPYDRLAKMITRLLNQRPVDAVDISQYLTDEHRNSFEHKVDTLIDKPDKTTETKLALIQKSLYMREGEDEDNIPIEQDEVETPLPNLMELMYHFEQAGVGLGREEMFRVWLALKQLVDRYPLETVRFWGKIFGTEQNYYIAEVKFQEGKDDLEEHEQDDIKDDELENEKEEIEEDDPIPKPIYKAPPIPPKEENNTGCNKFTYFVCNSPGKPWVRLPLITPLHIQKSRQIKHFFTGRLDAQIVSYPPFPGTEANYLRAQISRISAGTHISPLGFYRFDEEGEGEGDEEGGRDSYITNEEFEGIPVRELADPTLANWVHHVQHILPQGRTKWWNPKQKSDEEEMENDEEAEEDREEPEDTEPEVGPQLLTPLSEDSEIDGQPAWTAKVSSNLVSQFAICVVRSNLWPGAFAVGLDKKFENVYLGWGHKYSVENINPPLPPASCDEYPSGPEITEADDPTPQDEAQYQKAQDEADEQAEEQEDPAEEENEEEDE